MSVRGFQRQPWPAWFDGGRCSSKLQRRRVASGLHPFGFELGPETEICGTCAHRRTHHEPITDGEPPRPLQYPKCAIGPQSHGAATECRAKWRACRAWKPKP